MKWNFLEDIPNSYSNEEVNQAKSYGMNNNDKKRSKDNCWEAHIWINNLSSLEKNQKALGETSSRR